MYFILLAPLTTDHAAAFLYLVSCTRSYVYYFVHDLYNFTANDLLFLSVMYRQQREDTVILGRPRRVGRI